MICRNCKFILQGSEKFCPDCGQPCSEKATEEKATPSILYTEESTEESPIFRDAAQTDEKKQQRKKTSGPAFLVGLLIVCILTVGGFTVIEYFELAPVIKDYISPSTSGDQEVLQSTEATKMEDYSDSYGIISPDISFTPTICYVAADKSIALRKGPDNSYAQLDSVDSGVQLQIIGGSHSNDEWVYVHLPQQESYGWLSSSYLRQALPIQNNEAAVSEKETATDKVAETTQDTVAEPSGEAE